MGLIYKTVLLKLSGESLGGGKAYGIENDAISHYVKEIQSVVSEGIRLAVVLGGGNIYRGSNEQETGIEKAQGDYMGMLATLINCIALQSKLESVGVATRLMSAIKMDRVAEYFVRRRALRHLDKGRVIILGAGTGNPYFSTDTAASLRAIEMGADIILKGTRVDGVYDDDPEKNPKAVKFDRLRFQECIENGYNIMDMTAFSLCQENKLPIFVFDIGKSNTLKEILFGNHSIGTLIY